MEACSVLTCVEVLDEVLADEIDANEYEIQSEKLLDNTVGYRTKEGGSGIVAMLFSNR